MGEKRERYLCAMLFILSYSWATSLEWRTKYALTAPHSQPGLIKGFKQILQNFVPADQDPVHAAADTIDDDGNVGEGGVHRGLQKEFFGPLNSPDLSLNPDQFQYVRRSQRHPN